MIKPDLLAHSPNFKVATPTGKAVVIHATRSGVSMNPSEFQGTLNWFARPDVGLSAHWVIARDGRKARVVNDDCNAVHAGEHNSTHYGIELEQGAEADGFTLRQIEALVAVCQGYVKDFGVAAVHTLSSNASGFIGHSETTQGRRVGKSDPGAGFPWEGFISAVAGAVPLPVPPSLPAVSEVAHALAFAYTAYFERNPHKLHDFDKGVVEAVAKWLRT